jgi:predicted phage terminase large subunit-like protein
MTRLKPGGRIVVIMTRWHEDDLAGRLLEREPQRWTVIKLPMIAGDNDQLGREPGERLWKEWFTDEMVQQAQSDPRSWISLYQQEPRPIEGAEFKRSWISRFSVPPKKMNKVILVDPAGDPSKKAGTRKKSDRTVMWVVGLASDGNAYLLDGIVDRLSLTQRADKLFALHKKHKPMQVRYERYGMMGDIAHIQHEMEQRQYRFKITEVAGAVAKNARIRRLIPWFEGGRMWFPQSLKYTNLLEVETDLIQDLIDVEYATFPVGRYDDGMDALARLEEPTMTLPWPDDNEEWEVPTGSEHAWQAIDDVTGY